MTNTTAAASRDSDPVVDARAERRKKALAARAGRVADRDHERRNVDERVADMDRSGRAFLQGFADVVGSLTRSVDRLVDAIHIANANAVAVEAVRADVRQLRDALAAETATRLATSTEHKKKGG